MAYAVAACCRQLQDDLEVDKGEGNHAVTSAAARSRTWAAVHFAVHCMHESVSDANNYYFLRSGLFSGGLLNCLLLACELLCLAV